MAAQGSAKPRFDLIPERCFMRNLSNQPIWTAAICLSIALASAGNASAQALTAGGVGAEIAPFVQTTLLHTDYGNAGNLGFTAGVDYSRFMSSIVQPSVELRITAGSNAAVTERTYSGGLKLASTFHAIHPYAALLAGYGTIDFLHPVITAGFQPYWWDNSIVYSIGGGADFDVLRSWKLRVDFLQQFWHLPAPLTPTTLSVGIAYRLPFHTGEAR